MSDSAFRTALYPSLTAAQLRELAAKPYASAATKAELARRVAVDAGDRDLATDGEKLHGRVGKLALIENGGNA